MGPQASIYLHKLLITGDGSYRAPDKFPMILHASLPVPDFIASSESEDRAIVMIQDACAELPLGSAAAIGLACNTAHLLLDRLTNIPKTPRFVSMIDATVETIAANGYKQVGLLASPYTIRSELYHKALMKRNIEVIQPTNSDIKVLNDIIHDVVGNISPLLRRDKLTTIARKLELKGVDCILLGCTELPLVGVDSELPVIDSLSCLSTALLKKLPVSNT
jgi:aspartate racemase